MNSRAELLPSSGMKTPETMYNELNESGSSCILKSGLANPPQSPIVKKFLTLANGNESSTSNDTSPDSPTKKKLCDMPHTTTLQGCVAYVDVWSTDATDNRSSVFRNFLTRMGATVVRKFTKDQPVTHVVFKDGHKSVLQKAKKRNVKLVTCLWVDRCRKLQEWVNENDFLFDATNYVPPKRFIEMQPLEPEDLARRSAERLKRRRARFEKRRARIMFQSPLVTNCYSANGTPTAGNTPSDIAFARKYGIYAADTPFYPASLARMFSPSIVQDTPLSDSMKRMMKRVEEGKRIFSPPSSDVDSDEEKSLDRNKDGEMPPTSETRDVRFSPVADTQVVRKSWRESGRSPPKFDISCDEIPETQQAETPYLAEAPESPVFLSGRRRYACIKGDRKIPEPQDLTSSERTTSPNTVLVVPSTTDLHDSFESEEQERKEISRPDHRQDASVSRLNLHVSEESTFLEEELSCLELNRSREAEKDNSTPVGKEIIEQPHVISRKKRRKLLEDEHHMEPLSVLVSPQDNNKKQTTANRAKRMSMLLPEVGASAYKNIQDSGKFFANLQPIALSEFSYESEQSSCYSAFNSQSTTCGDSPETPQKQTSDVDNSLLSDLPLGLYDRIKMRKRRSSINYSTVGLDQTAIWRSFSQLNATPSAKKRYRKSDDSLPLEDVFSTPQKTKPARGQDAPQRVSSLFQSQAAKTILESIKKRRSSIDFTTMKTFSKNQKKKFVIVLTNFHADERSDVHNTMKSLSSFRMSSEVRDQTTHVVCGAARRTMNVLKAIAMGLRILSKNWVTDSASAGTWLEEESYEMVFTFPFSKTNQRCRGVDPMWRNELFFGYEGCIYIADNTKPSQDDLRELISLCGGRSVGSLRRASLCIGNPRRVIPNVPVVKETWLLDCICENIIKPLETYLHTTKAGDAEQML